MPAETMPSGASPMLGSSSSVTRSCVATSLMPDWPRPRSFHAFMKAVACLPPGTKTKTTSGFTSLMRCTHSAATPVPAAHLAPCPPEALVKAPLSAMARNVAVDRGVAGLLALLRRPFAERIGLLPDGEGDAGDERREARDGASRRVHDDERYLG